MVGETKLWDMVSQTSPENTTPNRFGTSICKYSQIKKATELWGPFGHRWGVRNPTFQELDKCLIYQAELFYQGDYGTFPIQSSIKSDVDDAAKKLAMDALQKGLSMLGFSADVYLGKFDDDKYIDTKENAKKQFVDEAKVDRAMNQLRKAEDFKKLWHAQSPEVRVALAEKYAPELEELRDGTNS